MVNLLIHNEIMPDVVITYNIFSLLRKYDELIFINFNRVQLYTEDSDTQAHFVNNLVQLSLLI